MAEVTGLTAARQLAIENNSIVDARLSGDDLILTTHGGVDINVGRVTGEPGRDADPPAPPIPGPPGPPGPSKNPVLNRAFFPMMKRWETNEGNLSIVAFGSSSHEGVGKNLSTQRCFNVFTELLRDYLYAGDNKDRGRGYIPAYYKSPYGLDDEPVASQDFDKTGNAGGLGARCVTLGNNMSNNGGILDFGDLDFGSSTSFDIVYTKRTEFFTGASMHVYVDDVKVQTVPTGNPTIEYGHTVSIPISPGVHNIKVKNEENALRAFRIEGLIHRTHDEGVILYDNMASGASLYFYLESPAALFMLESLVNIVPTPDLYLVGLGTNDMANGIPGLDDWENRLIALFNMLSIDGTENQSQPGVIFFMQGERIQDAADQNSVHVEYTNKLYEIANRYSNITIVEEKDLWMPQPGSNLSEQNPIGWLVDSVHHGILPARIMANHMFHTLTS